jgi:hypothetical protein
MPFLFLFDDFGDPLLDGNSFFFQLISIRALSPARFEASAALIKFVWASDSKRNM